MVKVAFTFWAGTLLSFTLTWKLEVVAVDDGVPEIVPDVLFNVSPAGRLPEAIFHLYGGVPPVAASVAEYGTPTVASGSDDVVICRGTAVALKQPSVLVSEATA